MRDLPAAVEVATYRVVDEALANVVRHARATRAVVDVSRDADTLRVKADDDGSGMQGLGASPRSGGVGLDSMRLRCQELGAALRVETLAPGIRIAATIPLS